MNFTLSQLKVGLLNIRSVRNKICYVAEILDEFSLDVLCLTETWLLASDVGVIGAALPKTYSLLHAPRPPGVWTRGGGVAVIYSSALSNIRQVSVDLDISSFEFMEVAININQQIVRIATVYRPGHPGTDRTFMNEFNSFMETFSSKNGKLLICGDFNYWVDDPTHKPYSSEFVGLFDLNNFSNYVSGPTHVSGHTLDLVLSPSDSDYLTNVDIVPVDPAISDHALVIFLLDFPRPPSYTKTIKFRNYRNIDQTRIETEIYLSLNEIDVSALSADHMVEMHRDFFLSTSAYHFPEVVKNIVVRDDFPWYDSSVVSLRRRRRQAERRWRRLRTHPARLEYMATRNAVISRVSFRKIEYYKQKVAACGGDQRQLFMLLNSLLHRKSAPVLPHSVSDATLASAFSNFFTEKVSCIRRALDVPLNIEFSVNFNEHIEISNTLLCFHWVAVEDVRGYIRGLNKTYCQLDPINMSKIPIPYESAAPFLTKIINKCFEESNFVLTEKESLIRPLLKKPGLDHENMANYRPVSNLTFLSKVIEQAMLDQLNPLFDQNGVIPVVQSAYRKFHSTESALCKIHDDLVINTCHGRTSLLVLLDLSAAFDTVDHDMLIEDLWFCGVRESALALLRSYLENRLQRVVVREALSEPSPLRCGVPQGSVLGPLLFLVYTRSLAALLDAHGVEYHFYADDTQICLPVVNIPDVKDKIITLLSDLKVWMTKRKLKLNDGKTEITIVRGNLRSSVPEEFGSLHFGGVQLHPVDSVRNLGVYFDPELNFREHIGLLVKNCNFHIRNIYAVQKHLDQQSLLTLVHALVVSRIDYCNSLWVGLPNYIVKKLQSVLNRAARLIYSLPSRIPTTPYLIELHWLPVKARIEFKLCLMTFKVVKFREPRYLLDLLSPQVDGPGMALRSSEDPYRLIEPRAIGERQFATRSFSYIAPRLYNRLPVSLKQLDSVEAFKNKLKSFFFSRAYDLDSRTVKDDYRL